jgi:hypothetical protein
MTDMSMTPIPIPPEAAASRPSLKALRVGPPPGVSDADCGTVESLAGISDEGYPMYANYWRPTTEQLDALQRGGFIELIQYTPRMAMHSMTVWEVPAIDDGPEVISASAPLPSDDCVTADRGGCEMSGRHEHQWLRSDDGDEQRGIVSVGPSGVVVLSEALMDGLMLDAGWVRA